MGFPKNNRYSLQHKDLQYKLLIIEVLIFFLPGLAVAYLFFANHISPDPSQIILCAFILILALAGIILLRQIFTGIFKAGRLDQAGTTRRMLCGFSERHRRVARHHRVLQPFDETI